MQGGADSAGACEQLLGHGLDLLAQTDGIQIHAKDIGTAVQSLQAGEVLLTGLHLQGSHDGLQLSQHRVSRDLEGLAVVVDALQVAGIACQNQRDEDEVGLVQTALLVGLDGRYAGEHRA